MRAVSEEPSGAKASRRARRCTPRLHTPPGHGAGALQESLEECASRCFNKYWVGVRRVSIDELGGDPLGPPPDAQRVHSLWRAIMKRPQALDNYLIAVDKHPEYPERVLEWCRSWNASSGGLLPLPTGLEVYGVISNQHLLYGLKALRNGEVCWAGTGERMAPPMDSRGDAIREHMNSGLLVQMISHKALIEDAVGVQALMHSNFLDNCWSSPPSQIDTVSLLFTKLREGTSAKSAVATVTNAVGNPFSKPLVRSMCELASTIDKYHLELLRQIQCHCQTLEESLFQIFEFTAEFIDEVAKFFASGAQGCVRRVCVRISSPQFVVLYWTHVLVQY